MCSDPEQPRLAALVARIGRRDDAALADLHAVAVARVYRYALRIVGNEQAAEEVASDVFMQIWNDALRYDGARAPVFGWIMMMCRSRALDHLRSRDPALLHDAPHTLTEEPRDAYGTPPDRLEMKQTHRALHAAVAALTPIQRQLLSLAFFRGLSHDETARQAQVPLGTGKSHIRRALKNLREVMC